MTIISGILSVCIKQEACPIKIAYSTAFEGAECTFTISAV